MNDWLVDGWLVGWFACLLAQIKLNRIIFYGKKQTRNFKAYHKVAINFQY